jgi:hypothetical protein
MSSAERWPHLVETAIRSGPAHGEQKGVGISKRIAKNLALRRRHAKRDGCGEIVSKLQNGMSKFGKRPSKHLRLKSKRAISQMRKSIF